jgi:protein O-mannosyl-transferase
MARKTGGKKKQRGPFGGDGKARRGDRRVVGPVQLAQSFGRDDLLIAASLAVAILAVYGQVITHQFISLDDDLYIRDNPMVIGGVTLPGILWALTTFHAANWHPLTWFSHMVDSQVFGLNAGGHLFVNALIHVSNTLLLFFFLKRVTGTRWRSAIVAALFALHPLHVESVAWAAERKDTLATFFGLLSLRAYASYVEAASWKRSALVTLWLGLGLMAKPMLVTWPFVLLLLDYWPLQRLEWQPTDGIKRFARAWKPLIREKLPLFCLVGASMVVTYLAQLHGGAVRGFVDAPLSLRLSNALVSYAKYLFLTVWPSGLGVYYPFSPAGVPAWQLAIALVLVVTITAIALCQASKRAYLIVGWLWFLGTLVPVIGLVQVGGQSMADRYDYIPSIGLFVAIVFGLADLAIVWHIGRVGLAAVSATALLLSASLTALQVSRWHDSITLFEHTLSVTSDNLVVHYNLGHVLGQEKKYDEAVPHFVEALRIKPDFFDALINMGVTLLEQGKPAEAISYCHRALDIEPDSAKAHMQLALALIKLEKGDDALVQFYKAMELSPNDPDVRTNLGLMLARKGRLSEATSQLNEALRLNPNSAEAHNNIGMVFLMAGQPEKGLPHFSEALRLKPDLAVAQDNLRRAQRQLGMQQK